MTNRLTLNAGLRWEPYFGQNILKHGRAWNDRVNWAFERALDREPTIEERRILTDLYRKSLEQFQHSSADAVALIHEGEAPVPTDLKPAELAAMTTVARAVLNLHETITRN